MGRETLPSNRLIDVLRDRSPNGQEMVKVCLRFVASDRVVALARETIKVAIRVGALALSAGPVLDVPDVDVTFSCHHIWVIADVGQQVAQGNHT